MLSTKLPVFSFANVSIYSSTVKVRLTDTLVINVCVHVQEWIL